MVDIAWGRASDNDRHARWLFGLTLLNVPRPFVHRVARPAAHSDPSLAPFTECSVRLQLATVRLFSQVLNSLFLCSSDHSGRRFRDGFIIVSGVCWGRRAPVGGNKGGRRTVGSWTYLDLFKAFNEALVKRFGDGVVGVVLGVFPLFPCTGVRGVLLIGLGLDSASESPTAAKRDRFGEGGGRLQEATDQHLGGLSQD